MVPRAAPAARLHTRRRDRRRAGRASLLSRWLRRRRSRPAEARATGEYDRYRLGIHHLAFTAPSREVVDERHRWLVEREAAIENEPREYAYLPGYYATFFYDPDGIKLEILHVPEQRGEA